MNLTILRETILNPAPTDDVAVMTWDELRHRVRQRDWRLLWRYRDARMLTYRTHLVWRPLTSAVMVRLLARRRSCFEDEQGRSVQLTLPVLARMATRCVADYLHRRSLVRRVQQEIGRLSTAAQAGRRVAPAASPVYLRADLTFGLPSGGSIGHIAGVLNNLGALAGAPPVFLTTDRIPTVDTGIETHLLALPRAFWDLPQVCQLASNESFASQVQAVLGARAPAFFYQRNAVNNYTGVQQADRYGVPCVLEYNGSEIWVGRNWGRALRDEAIAERVELLNLQAADVITVVSRPLLDELVERGIDADKILLNPNGVDPERYSPAVDGSQVRARYQLDGKTVVGFIGTFGPWHGAEVLAAAYGRLLQAFPQYRERVRLLMVGDGPTMPLVQENLTKFNVGDACVRVGRVPQEEGGAHLAACDLLASPHVPNRDGTPFFGSPTKLFEYMAMGKGIVASNLDQIGEVLEHGRTAWMVPPGDPEALLHGLRMLIDNPALRERLGTAARCAVVAKHTWREHTRRIMEKLEERCGRIAECGMRIEN